MLAAVVLALVAPCQLTFVRHGETEANATGKYNAQTIDSFSAKGVQQVQALTLSLQKQPKYDLILVSPSPRALRTVAPYLKATGQKATVWPLLYECCTGKDTGEAATKFTWGGKISLPKDIEGLFRLDPAARYPSSPTWGAGLAQVEASVKQFRADFAKGRVLIVGHSGHGGQFLARLDGKKRRLENAKPVELTLTSSVSR
ncbi:MAG: histidine phosphatase family protein [Armatimonadetes bacterium]|nr:histidine phosphatase family protein [Armatimonadota bacterium]